MHDIKDWYTVTGAIVWFVVALGVLLWIIFGVIPAIWEQACRTGFEAMASNARKIRAKELGRNRADTDEREEQRRLLRQYYDWGREDTEDKRKGLRRP